VSDSTTLEHNLPFDIGNYYVVIPLGDKAPTAPGWNKKENCISEAIHAEILKGNNVGIALAYSRIVHLDVDNWSGAKKHFEEKGFDLKEVISDAGCVFTSGRKHSIGVLYKLPESVIEIPPTVIYRDHSIAPDGVVAYELRCGTATNTTSMSVIPNSMHPGGTFYKFVQGDLRTMSEIPSWMLASMLQTNDVKTERKKPQKHVNESAAKSFDESETPRKRALMIDMLRYISPNCDYITWRDCVWAILSTGWPSAYDIAHKWSAKSDVWNSDMFSDLITKYEPGRNGRDGAISAGKIYYYARIGGYRG